LLNQSKQSTVCKLGPVQIDEEGKNSNEELNEEELDRAELDHEEFDHEEFVKANSVQSLNQCLVAQKYPFLLA
ncbi:14378_t:CDS:2, partial [Gigaspora rosea]